jgi:hypothetical protein
MRRLPRHRGSPGGDLRRDRAGSGEDAGAGRSRCRRAGSRPNGRRRLSSRRNRRSPAARTRYDPAGTARPVPLAPRPARAARRLLAALRASRASPSTTSFFRGSGRPRPDTSRRSAARTTRATVLRPGNLLWTARSTRIGPNEVILRQNLNDPQSVKPFRDVTKQLNADDHGSDPNGMRSVQREE